tara:strand:+ start:111 stop:974 length:864 start_codon:yes stop_codon:yes gene_type:complete
MHSFATGTSDGRVMREGLDRFCGVSWRERAALLAISQSQLVASVDEDGKRMRQEALRHISKHIQLKSPSSVPFPKVTSEIDRDDVVEVLDVAGSEEATAARLKELARERAEAERMHDEWMQESRIRMERMRAEVEAEMQRIEEAGRSPRDKDSAYHSEVSSNAESAKKNHEEEEGENQLSPSDANEESSWIDSLVVPSMSAARKHSIHARNSTSEKRKLTTRLRQAFGFFLRDRILLHILVVAVMTKAGRKQKRASKGNAETEEGIHKSVHLVTRLKSRLPRLEVFA